MNYVLIAIATAVLFTLYALWVRRARRGFVAAYAFPAGLRKKFAEVRPGLSEVHQDQVFEALRQWFMVCGHANRQFVSMPSQVVDDAWHAFILFTRNYELFCRKAFGRFLHHTPAEAMAGQTTATEGIKRTWRIACRLENIDPKTPGRLPALFAIDAALGIANGFHYELDCKPGSGTYCAGGIGCGSGCGSDGGDSGCGSGCGGD